ncbi:ABC transporter ATP-binding protein [Paralimibaculum aggregatum]|uniref:ABC transporter ATP-binding protein n=1 Tax=Paralimibaculum aggregatum TaxID=3036245 RepID=A0ABQ6LST2_9RHOB|nr:ABC transporter ATP-binding protein [Limibaculum sp. NKW23]GMG85131.1 ABC transporter ATP-binding protein [Limibaculum sp. NKW23]
MAEMVRLDGITKAYGETVALHPTDLSIREGEFVTLLGPSGSGKTTLLNLIAGSTAPSAGEIWLKGRDVTQVPANRRELGMVFQNYALFPHMTVAQNVAFPLTLRRRPRAEIRREVMRALELVHLPHVAKRKPRELSGGQQQRIAIARSLVYNPSLILMDEPLGALDRKLREALQFEIKKLHEELRMTVLYVTHDQEEALTMSNRICLMNEGRMEQVAPPQEMYFRPATEFAAGFLGVSNIIRVAVEGRGAIRVGERFALSGVPGLTAAPGEVVPVMIRPEAIRLAAGSAAENVLEAEVEDVVFLGGVTNLVVRTGQGERFTVRQLTRRSDAGWQGGMPVSLSFDASDVVPLNGAAPQ